MEFDDILAGKLAKPLAFMTEGSHRIFGKQLSAVFGLREVQDAAQKAKRGIGLRLSVVGGNFKMPFRYQRGCNLIHWTAVPRLEVHAVVALVVILGTDSQLANGLKRGIGIREGRDAFGHPPGVDTTLHILKDLAGFLSRYLGHHPWIGANGVANGLALNLRFSEKCLRLGSNSKAKTW